MSVEDKLLEIQFNLHPDEAVALARLCSLMTPEKCAAILGSDKEEAVDAFCALVCVESALGDIPPPWRKRLRPVHQRKE
jgi:hypothetical protein